MSDQRAKALEAAAELYATLPNYLFNQQDKNELNVLLLDLINALDLIEFKETGEPFFAAFKSSPYESKFWRKRAVLMLTNEYGLTEREMQILAYLENGRNTTYIADTLGIAKATAKAHKYSIYKKLHIHTAQELKELLREYEERRG
jgi:DNA-binding CsgD family transcriptional regulator